ncbi:hypothetical protein [Amycolatopsis sp. NPDC051371]|uniref:hypothetical protein n=1 Tax=Amycolatopsis sp. NPDC051371 TaxID=3155800 RepID=UPI0034323FF0
MATCSLVADAMNALVSIASELVQAVHDAVRDLIANTVAEIIEDVIEAGCGPIGWAAIAEESIGYIARQIGKGTKLVDDLVEVIGDLADEAGKLLIILDEARKIWPALQRLAQEGGKLAAG